MELENLKEKYDLKKGVEVPDRRSELVKVLDEMEVGASIEVEDGRKAQYTVSRRYHSVKGGKRFTTRFDPASGKHRVWRLA